MTAPVQAQDEAAPFAAPLGTAQESAEDRAVTAILETKPDTPARQLRAAKIIQELRQPERAKPLLAALLAQKPNAETLVALSEEFGTGFFIRLALDEALQPEGKEISDLVHAAVRKHTRDPKRIQALIGQLNDKDEDARREAAQQLTRSGDRAVVALIEALGKKRSDAERARIVAALQLQGSTAVDPLIAALESSNEEVVTSVIEALAALDAGKSVLYLLAPALAPDSSAEIRQAAAAALQELLGRTPQAAEAAGRLAAESQAYLKQQRPLNPDLENRIDLWRWDDEKDRLVLTRPLAADGSLAIADRLARDWLRLQPESQAAREQRWIAGLELEAYTAGLDQPLPRGAGAVYEQASGAEIDAVYSLLQHALAGGHDRAATAAATIVGEKGRADLLLRDAPRPSALVNACRAADRRVRFAALGAVMALRPEGTYPGSSEVVESLLFLARGYGARRALVAEPRFDQAQSLSGMLQTLQYEVDIARSTDELLRMVLQAPYDLAIVDVTLRPWPMRQVLQRLRAEPRTAGLPLGLIAPLGEGELARQFGQFDARADIFVRPVEDNGMQFLVESLLNLEGRHGVTDAERTVHARQAFAWLADLAATGQHAGKTQEATQVGIHGLLEPELTEVAARLLSSLAHPAAQRALVDHASQSVLPIASRRLAANAFQTSLTRFGPLLTTEQIELQYERYNDSEVLDAETQELLAFVLDLLEAGAENP